VNAQGGADLPWMLRFLAARSIPGLEQVSPSRYARCIRVNDAPHLIDITVGFDNRSGCILETRAWPPLATRLRESLAAFLFDLGMDLRPYQRLARGDPILGPLVERRPGLRIPRLVDPFEGVVRAIVGQVVSIAAARTVVTRIVTCYGDEIAGLGAERLRTFPLPPRLAGVAPAALAKLGLSASKARAIVACADAFARGDLESDHLRSLSSTELDARLMALPGVGAWTSAYLRMRVWGDRDAFPANDHGVIAALRQLGVQRDAIPSTAERWRPWRAYATLQLWASLAD